ncbi:MAG: hypothetical protein AAGG79_07410, partial [Pseudomonadota bacterium]
ATLLAAQLQQAGIEAITAGAEGGYLNAFGLSPGALILEAQPSALNNVDPVEFHAAAILNLSEEDGRAVGNRTREACAELLARSHFAVLGVDDNGAQSLLMTLRKKEPKKAGALVPISGGATLSDGWFAIDRVVYAIRNGRTRRVANYAASAVLIGDHFAQDAAAASALASHLGLTDDAIAAGLLAFQGCAGRFECIGADGRIVFVDDRYAACEASTRAAIAACPDVFWIGCRTGPLNRHVEAGLRGRFFVQADTAQSPPVDDVVTFADVESASVAALQAAREYVAADPSATPVLLYSPGLPGFDRQGELFRLMALGSLSGVRTAHG